MHLVRKKIKQESSELDIFLTLGMVVFSSSNEKKKKNNHKLYHNENKELDSDKFQVEAEKKIDALIAKYEKEIKYKELKSIPQKGLKDSTEILVETREHIKKKPDIPYLKTVVKSEDVVDTLKPLDTKEERIDIKKTGEIIDNNFSDESSSSNKKITSSARKTYLPSMKLPRIKIRSKGEMRRLKKKKNKTKREIPYQNSTKVEKNKIKEDDEMNFKKDIKEKSSEKKKILFSDSQDTQKYKTLSFNDELKNRNKDSESGMQRYIIEKKDVEKENPLFDEDIKKVLEITDNLLGKLPDEVIDEFIKSKDYELYEKIINKYKIK